MRRGGSALRALAVPDAPLGERTTYRVGGRARWLATPVDVEGLRALARVVADEGWDVRVVGRGSNLLVADEGFDGLAVVLGEPFATLEPGDGLDDRIDVTRRIFGLLEDALLAGEPGKWELWADFERLADSEWLDGQRAAA